MNLLDHYIRIDINESEYINLCWLLNTNKGYWSGSPTSDVPKCLFDLGILRIADQDEEAYFVLRSGPPDFHPIYDGTHYYVYLPLE